MQASILTLVADNLVPAVATLLVLLGGCFMVLGAVGLYQDLKARRCS